MDKKKLLRAAGVLIGLALGAGGVYLLRPPCLILQHTGWYCAGCGTQRMVAAALRGDWAAAFRHNPFMFLLLPLTGAYALWEAWRYAHGESPLYKKKGAPYVLTAVLFLGAAFMVLRNLPGAALLGP